MTTCPALRQARKYIDAEALASNYRCLQKLCGGSRLMAVVKADAYGHGLQAVVRVLQPIAHGFAVATVAEGLFLRRLGVEQTVLIMQGFTDEWELSSALSQNLSLLIHAPDQLKHLQTVSGDPPPSLWIKLDTGMNRLGFVLSDLDEVINSLSSMRLAHQPVLTSHFSCADDSEQSDYTQMQWSLYQRAQSRCRWAGSIANSAAALSGQMYHLDWVRAGIALYGAFPSSSPLAGRLRPVMTMRAPIIALRTLPAGARVGYGGDYVCPDVTHAAVLSMGYGDGYPRAAGASRPVFINGRICQTIGRISMDMMTVDLADVSAQVGDYAELWGSRLPVARVAEASHTIAYELLCSASTVAAAEPE